METEKWKIRLAAGLVFALSLGWLVYGATLEPDEAGLGTHKQMGLAACSWVAQGTGPCPTCGMTTAFSLAARGNVAASFATQPAAAVLALLAAMTVWVSGYTMWTGCTEVRHLGGLLRLKMLLIVAGFILLAWAYTRWMHGSIL